ncbi:MAG: lipid-A-disaccharide synthase [Gammaproteobacteria bacterium]|nr:lipid-A-disaccharide synthase [Gammaproteobacteria bacterium]
MMVAGEASGDLHAANFVKELKRLEPGTHFYGIAGPRMRAEGVEAVHDASELSVVGLIEPLLQYRRLSALLREMQERVCRDRPDLLVLTDYPDFNLRLARTANACGVKVLFYVSPQVWAWRQGRVKGIGEVVDMMAVIFPFETQFYEQHGIPVRYVGHPLVDEVKPSLSREQAIQHFGLDPDKQTVGLFPGSRRGEIKRLLPIILESAKIIQTTHPDVQFILPIASSLSREMIQPCLDAVDVEVILVDGQSYDVAQTCDAIITASGTATLEVAMMGIPMAITYKVAWLTYAIVGRMIKIPIIGLANIVAGEEVAKEFVQSRARPEAIAAEIMRILDDPDYARIIREKLGHVKEKLGEGGGSEKLARLALEMLED